MESILLTGSDSSELSPAEMDLWEILWYHPLVSLSRKSFYVTMFVNLHAFTICIEVQTLSVLYLVFYFVCVKLYSAKPPLLEVGFPTEIPLFSTWLQTLIYIHCCTLWQNFLYSTGIHLLCFNALCCSDWFSRPDSSWTRLPIGITLFQHLLIFRSYFANWTSFNTCLMVPKMLVSTLRGQQAGPHLGFIAWSVISSPCASPSCIHHIPQILQLKNFSSQQLLVGMTVF